MEIASSEKDKISKLLNSKHSFHTPSTSSGLAVVVCCTSPTYPAGIITTCIATVGYKFPLGLSLWGTGPV